MQKILILGSSGQLGSALAKCLPVQQTILWKRPQYDFAQEKELLAKLDLVSPSIIINAAAYTQVDQAEEDRANCEQVNAEGPALLSSWCKVRRVPLVHFSTDYVYSDTGSDPISESHETKPLNYYGETKLKGDQNIIESGCDHIIFRSSWIYDAVHKNFFTAILRKLFSDAEVRVVNDQVGSPTYAPHLAQATAGIVRNILMGLSVGGIPFPSGIYHLCSSDYVSWHGFTESIAELARKNELKMKCEIIKPISSSEYPALALRPQNSRLNCQKAESTLGIRMPHWKEGLAEAFKQWLDWNPLGYESREI